ncbi:MAG TPA: PhzF family phenazine biosynthesis protein [Terriglobales bacterium]|nr:PhzF family phenazine biosynthesis protein [Terriglobales bacterium]
MQAKERRRYPFIHLDVFTSKPLEGNQLCVIPDASGLSDGEMQTLAREFNLSETTFVLPRDIETERQRGIRVRIFTTQEELPFAGHPTLGTAFALHGEDRRQSEVFRTRSKSSRIELDLNVGKIPVEFTFEQGRLYGEMTQRDPQFGQIHHAEEVARAANLNLRDVDASLPIQTVSTGNAFAIVPLKSLQAIRGLGFVYKNVAEYCEKTDAKFLYFVTREVEDKSARLHARMLFYNGEDPATGSAAGPCVAWAVRHGVLQSDEKALIEQGLEMKRRSHMYVRATRTGDRVTNVRVGGHVVEVMRGEVSF